jgi:hypothetical protein
LIADFDAAFVDDFAGAFAALETTLEGAAGFAIFDGAWGASFARVFDVAFATTVLELFLERMRRAG